MLKQLKNQFLKLEMQQWKLVKPCITNNQVGKAKIKVKVKIKIKIKT